MSGRPAQIIVEPDGRRLGSHVHIARELGTYRQQVEGWVRNRRTGGFPEPVRRGMVAGREVDLYDLDECRVWRYFVYDPQPGVPLAARTADPTRGAPAAVGRHLGVTTAQVCKWIDARARSGCPVPGEDGLYAFADWEAWLVWYRTEYRPQTGVRIGLRTEDPARGGPAAVGRHLGVPVKQVARWVADRRRTHCPEPGEDGLYAFADWEAWHAAWQQRPGVTAALRRSRAA